MSTEFKAAICPNCGAKIHFPGKADRTTCQHCGVTVFIDRHEMKVWIIERPINVSLFSKLAKKVTNTDEEYSIEGLAELMAQCDNKVFPYPKSEAKRFIEWMNQRDDITILKRRVELPYDFSMDVFRFYTKGREYTPYECGYCGYRLPRKDVYDDTICPKCGNPIMYPPLGIEDVLDGIKRELENARRNPNKYSETHLKWLVEEKKKLEKWLTEKGKKT